MNSVTEEKSTVPIQPVLCTLMYQDSDDRDYWDDHGQGFVCPNVTTISLQSTNPRHMRFIEINVVPCARAKEIEIEGGWENGTYAGDAECTEVTDDDFDEMIDQFYFLGYQVSQYL